MLSLEEALRFWSAWTDTDRDLVRAKLEAEYPGLLTDAAPNPGNPPEADTAMLSWYVPPSGSYVAGHRGRKSHRPADDEDEDSVVAHADATAPGDEPISSRNLVYLHPGFAILRADAKEPVRIELSSAHLSGHTSHSPAPKDPPVCPTCFLAHAGECP